MPEKWWETVARLARERLQLGFGNSGCARVRRCASGSCPGVFRVLSEPQKSIFGALRASVAPKVDRWSPLSVRCFPKFIHGQRKERLQPGLGIHSDLGISRLKIVLPRQRVDELSAWFGEFQVRKGAPGCIRELSGSVSGSFRGRRMWPLARKSADPGEACGAVLKRFLGGKTLLAIHGK